MLFKYTVIDAKGVSSQGTIDAINVDVAITSLQRRGFVISSIKEAESKGGIFQNISLFDRVTNKDVVILSRQMATLFTSQVSALRIFKLLATESDKPGLRKVLAEIADDIQSGGSISSALSKHPKAFSTFYVNMVKAGEESGRLDETFLFLADYLDRSYEVTSKVKNALIYPSFVILTFVAVMSLMLTVVIPKISAIIVDSGREVPVYTKAVIGLSNFLVDYGLYLLGVFVIFVLFLVRFAHTEAGKGAFAEFKLGLPYIGSLYKKLYLSRISDNMDTLLASGIPMVKALELTSTVVDNRIYERVMMETLEGVKSGMSLSDSASRFPEMPNIMVAMMKVGEETGQLSGILKTLAKFYQREVVAAVDTLVDLIEPLMIVLLGLGVGFLLASVLIPIYNVSASF